MRGGQLLREARETRKLSLEQVAREAGISQRTLRNTEAGRHNPLVSTLVALIEYLDLEADKRLALLKPGAWSFQPKA
jgi:transcriptional regulator with XRE-family HTH domain